MREFVQLPMNTVSTATSRTGVPAVRPMYSSARAALSRSFGSAKSSGDGMAPASGTTWAGLVPQETCGAMPAASRCTSLSNAAPLVGGQGAPVVEGRLPRRARRGVGPSLEVGEGDVVGRDEPGLGAGLDRHVADRHAALHREPGDRVAAVLDHRADPAARADAPDDGEDHVLGGGAGGQLAGDGDRHRARPLLGERLRGEHVLDLAGADAEGRARRRRRGWTCGCRRTRSSCPGACGPAPGRSRGRCPGWDRPSRSG